MDPDTILNEDINELLDIEFDEPVAVVKGKNRFEWPSVMLFNNEKCQRLTYEWVNDPKNKPHVLESWAESIHELPKEWNHCVPYDDPAPAKLIHFTAGIPHLGQGQPPEVSHCEYAAAWNEEANEAMKTVPWETLMSNSVHRKVVGM